MYRYSNTIIETSPIIEKEINNYETYKEIIINYLNNNPLIKIGQLIKYARDLYRQSSYSFDLSTDKIKNIFYNWKRNNFIFTKYSVFKNNKTIYGDIYLRDYSSKYIYKNLGNNVLLQEHIIFISSFQIRKVISPKHLFFDCTFFI